MPLSVKALLALMLTCLVLVAALLFVRSPKGVVVYTSVDDEYAQPLFDQFTKDTGIPVIARIDGELTKTTQMAQRLLALQSNPDGDVFWNSEMSHTQLLAQEGLFEPYASPSAADIPGEFKDAQQRWTGFGCRARVLIYNTGAVKRAEVPATLEGLADPRWKGRFCVADPHFGTTRSHLVALVLKLGEDKAFKLFSAWRDNGLILARSNGDVRNRVADGTCDLGLTDTDDVLSAMERNKPVDFTVPGQSAEWPGAFLIPNTVAIIKNAPHAKEARLFVDYLLRPQTEVYLAEHGARQIPVRKVPAQLAKGLENLEAAVFDSSQLGGDVSQLVERIFVALNPDTKK